MLSPVILESFSGGLNTPAWLPISTLSLRNTSAHLHHTWNYYM